VFTAEVICDSQIFGSMMPCPPGPNYPRSGGKVIMHALPHNLQTMPNPCAGVPANPWCPRSRSATRRGSGGPRFTG
jgi:hypothetical protein